LRVISQVGVKRKKNKNKIFGEDENMRKQVRICWEKQKQNWEE